MNSKGADQSAQMCRLVCACVVRKPPKDRFSHVKAQLACVISGMKGNDKIKNFKREKNDGPLSKRWTGDHKIVVNGSSLYPRYSDWFTAHLQAM